MTIWELRFKNVPTPSGWADRVVKAHTKEEALTADRAFYNGDPANTWTPYAIVDRTTGRVFRVENGKII